MTDRHDTTRREFIAASAAGLITMMRLAPGDAPEDESQLLYVGTYTDGTQSKGIYLVRLNTRTGELRDVGAVSGGPNPSFLALHPNGRVLYAVNEVEKREGKAAGGVSAFTIARNTGALAALNEQSSEGGAPCYVSVDRRGRAVLVANYVGGNVALLPIDAKGNLSAAAKVAQHSGKGPNAERQEGPHAHCIMPDPSNRFALAADLGVDRVLVYRLDAARGALEHLEKNDAVLKPGAGPRHIAFHPKLPLVYVANELDSTVTTMRFNRETGALSPRETHSTLDPDWHGENFPADIHVASSGRTLYVSNRGHNSIAVFSIGSSNGALKLEQLVPTGGDWPRNFALDPTGRWLLVAHQRSNSVIVFRRDALTGRLTQTQQRLELPSPVCLRFRTPVA
jgi:6-phosphogluconolactonase